MCNGSQIGNLKYREAGKDLCYAMSGLKASTRFMPILKWTTAPPAAGQLPEVSNWNALHPKFQ